MRILSAPCLVLCSALRLLPLLLCPVLGQVPGQVPGQLLGQVLGQVLGPDRPALSQQGDPTRQREDPTFSRGPLADHPLRGPLVPSPVSPLALGTAHPTIQTRRPA